MKSGIRWTVNDKESNSIYLSQERWDHIIEPVNHPEMLEYEEELKKTIQLGKRTQDPVNPQKYRYSMPFDNLAEYNTHIVAVVLYRFRVYESGFVPNNFIVTAYQKEIG